MAARCPHCNVPLTQDEQRSGQCPACGASLDEPSRGRDDSVREGRPTAARGDFEDAARSRPAPRDYDDDYDDRPIRRSSYGANVEPGWGTAQAGLTTMFYGFLTIVITYVLSIVLLLLMLGVAFGGGFGGRNQGPDLAIMVPVCILLLGFFGGGIAHLVGMFMCLASPQGKGWIGGSLMFVGLVILIFIGLVIYLISLGNQRGFNPNPNAEVVMLVWIACFYGALFMAIVCIIIFANRIGKYFRNSFLSVVSNVLLGTGVIMVGIMVALMFANNQGNAFQPFARGGGFMGQGNALAIGGSIVMLVLVLTNVVLYCIVLRSARNTIARAGGAY